uniref:NADH dehydrogenase subunit 4 n=1 Tax=Paradiplozoon yunnanensis TaxID=2268894 RepID=UPI001FAFC89B|nr:NADH dehydrogenase subunit 4 [Paradiplozoon yunnanensis]UKP90069.1 NADH dehydrogenase subunit 4 [Paradiplozoon yunnanensis]
MFIGLVGLLSLWYYFFCFFIFLLVLLGFWFNGSFLGLYFVGLYFDYLFFYISFLVVLIFLFILGVSYSTSFIVTLLLFLSCFFSVMCCCVYNCVIFWGFYELSILFVLFLLFFDSPYSDRFLAGWYLLCYFVFCGFPLLGCLIYFFYLNGSFNFLFWDYYFFDEAFFGLFVVFFLFVAKVPLPPFHSWLPVVHAEASSFVSVCLSGYIMKLGLVGILRFCFCLLGNGFLYFYFFCLFPFCVLIIFSCSEELDYKRWLAMLSVGHIMIGVLCLLSYDGLSGFCNSLLFGLGHGLSACFFFFFIYYLELIGGSRVIPFTNVVFGWGLSSSLVCLFGYMFVASFPPFITFFIEVWLLFKFSIFSIVFFIWMLFYLFFSSLIPFCIFGSILGSRFSFNSSIFIYGSGFLYFFIGIMGLILLI